MTDLYHTEDEPQYICWDRANYSSFEDQLTAIKNSKTVYVGNLSFFTKESQILETFSTVGPVKRIIMGLNNLTKTPCGFCFVEYYYQEHTDNALKYLTETVCDERLIRCDADGGFLPGRQFGRGKSGGQIRDERRFDYDPARGRFIPPSILGNQRYNNHRGGGGGGGNRNFQRTSSRDDNGRDDRHYGSNKRTRRNYEGNYHDRSDDRHHNDDRNDGERDERDYDHRRKHHQRRNNHHQQQQYNPHYQPQYQRQNSGDMEASLYSSLDTPRD